jgi:hypothetical protein
MIQFSERKLCVGIEIPQGVVEIEEQMPVFH